MDTQKGWGFKQRLFKRAFTVVFLGAALRPRQQPDEMI
jgi:hypothetical protein